MPFVKGKGKILSKIPTPLFFYRQVVDIFYQKEYNNVRKRSKKLCLKIVRMIVQVAENLVRRERKKAF